MSCYIDPAGSSRGAKGVTLCIKIKGIYACFYLLFLVSYVILSTAVLLFLRLMFFA